MAPPSPQDRTEALHELAYRWRRGAETPISVVTIGRGICARDHTDGSIRGHLLMIGIVLQRTKHGGVLAGDAVALRQHTWALLYPPGAEPDEYTIANTRLPLGQVRARLVPAAAGRAAR